MPSVQDVSHEREYRQKEINQIKEKIALNGDKFQHTGEKRFSQIVIHLKNKLEMQQTSLRKLDDHTNDSQGLGELQYGSGLGRGLDWSLSSFSDRKIKNTPPEKDEVKVVMDAANMDFEEVDAALQRFGWSTEANISYPEIDGLVIKQGRSTGLTVGKVNALPSDVLISVPDLESISEPLNLRKDVGIEVRAILEKGNGFARKGDSGAWVLNMDSDWIGSIVGVQTPRTSGPGTSTALVLEAKKIVDDIETFSGMKVVSPGRLG
ncbi:MAG: hypothetical protein M1822_008719 [Bathelium mastoideum]|nr:MAG: hypothetical protein M1822_008719 [Bathelium mastoideum]